MRVYNQIYYTEIFVFDSQCFDFCNRVEYDYLRVSNDDSLCRVIRFGDWTQARRMMTNEKFCKCGVFVNVRWLEVSYVNVIGVDERLDPALRSRIGFILV